MNKAANNIIGYIFLANALIFLLLVLGYIIFSFSMPNVRFFYALFGAGLDGSGASMVPIFTAILAAVGAYLVKS